MITSGEFPRPRWTENTIEMDVTKAMSLVEMYDYNDFCEDTIYEECDHYHGNRNYHHPEPESEKGKEDWLLWNEVWREVLFKRLIAMKLYNVEVWNYCDEYRDEVRNLKNEMKEKDKKIDFLEELNSSYLDQIDSLRFQLLHTKENVNEIA